MPYTDPIPTGVNTLVVNTVQETKDSPPEKPYSVHKQQTKTKGVAAYLSQNKKQSCFTANDAEHEPSVSDLNRYYSKHKSRHAYISDSEDDDTPAFSPNTSQAIDLGLDGSYDLFGMKMS